MKCWLHPEAEAELDEAAQHYARHANLAVALAFLAEFETVCELVAENPRRAQQAEHGLRIFHFDRFPYSLIYEPDEGVGARVYALAHQHRAPGYWSQRIEP